MEGQNHPLGLVVSREMLQDMAAVLHGDWRMETLQSIAGRHGLEWRQPGSSHVTFRRKDGAKLTVPARKPIKAIYIKQFITLLQREGHG